MNTHTPTLTQLQADADRFRFVRDFYKSFNTHMSRKAERKLAVTEGQILKLRRSLHTSTNHNPDAA